MSYDERNHDYLPETKRLSVRQVVFLRDLV